MQIEKLEGFDSIEQLFVNLSVLADPFWLDSALEDKRLGRYSFMGALPMASIISDKQGVRVILDGEAQACSQNALEALDTLMGQFEITETSMWPFTGGAVGFLSYDLKRQIEKLPETAEDDLNVPDMAFKLYDILLAIDHHKREVCLISHAFSATVASRVSVFRQALLKHQVIPTYRPRPTTFSSDQTRESYLSGVEQVRAYIRSGDIYQANYTQRISCPYEESPLALYLNLRRTNPAPFAAFLPYEDFQILSSSPERFIQIRDRQIETRPIKGTIKRGKTVDEDLKHQTWLKNSDKDRSELLMIVDLERNDLSRICEVGSVQVPELFEIESYKTVFHLVSTVIGKLEPQCTFESILRATFPGGSITGAPKIRAMEVIDSLECHARGIYTGSIGYIGFDGSVDLNIVIRTLLLKQDTLTFGVGGGIVWDSDPQSEYEESLTKGKALMEAISGGAPYDLEQWGSVGKNSFL